MSPIDTIINMLDSYAAEALKQVESTIAKSWSEGKFQEGKAAGLKEAADHLRNLQKLFN